MFSENSIYKLIVIILLILLSNYSILATIILSFLFIYLTKNNTFETFKNKLKQNQYRNVEINNPPLRSYQEDKNHLEIDNKKDRNNQDSKLHIAKQQKNKKMKQFRNNNCTQAGILIKDNKPVTNISDAFPNLDFNSQQCNPCDDNCEFDIVSTNEMLTLSENLKSIDSNIETIDRKKAIKKKS